MLLRRVTKHVTDQNWFAVVIDFFIVVVGVFIGIQVANWNAVSKDLAKEQVYLTRLSQELNVTIERLESGSELFLSSVNACQFLLDARDEFQNSPETYVADEAALKNAFDIINSGRVPASSPAVFEEMVANGELTLIRNTKLRQALYEFDEFSNVALHAWKTLRDQLLDAIEPTIGILIYKKIKPNQLDPNQDSLIAHGFDAERFHTQSDLSGALSYAMEAQENQLNLVQRHLELARAILVQLNKPMQN
jgi:hypothetical protein